MLDGFDWNWPVQLDRRQHQQVFTLEFLARKERVVSVGPVGVDKTMLAQFLGSASVRDEVRRAHGWGSATICCSALQACSTTAA